MIEGEPVQRVHDEVELVIGHWSLVIGEEKSMETIIQDFVHPFDLAQAPLLRVGLVKTGENNHILMLDTHHIITDGTSLDAMLRPGLQRGTERPPDHRTHPQRLRLAHPRGAVVGLRSAGLCLAAEAIPRIAKLMLSVALPVKRISEGCPPIA